jgi:hypothetical protein
MRSGRSKLPTASTRCDSLYTRALAANSPRSRLGATVDNVHLHLGGGGAPSGDG